MANRKSRRTVSVEIVAEFLKDQCLKRVANLLGADEEASRIASSMFDVIAPTWKIEERTVELSNNRVQIGEWRVGTGKEFERALHALDLLERIAVRQTERFNSQSGIGLTSLPLTKSVLWKESWRGFLFFCDLDEAIELAPRLSVAGLSTSTQEERRKFEKVVGEILKNDVFGLPSEIEQKKKDRSRKLRLLVNSGEHVALKLVAHALVNNAESPAALLNLIRDGVGAQAT